MATMRKPDTFAEVSVKLSELEVPQEDAVSQTEANDLMKQAPAVESRKSPVDEIDAFFDLAIEELTALRTCAEVDAIERAADLILECEAHGGRVHATGIGKSEHVARYVASLLSSTGTSAYFLLATECVHGS